MIKKTLSKPFQQRSEGELNHIVSLLKKVQFFKDKPISNESMLELAQSMKFERLQGMQNCMNFGEKGNKFYIILKGVVSVQIPNQQIKNLQLKRKDYASLLDWKKTWFDPKAEAAKQERIEAYQQQTETK